MWILLIELVYMSLHNLKIGEVLVSFLIVDVAISLLFLIGEVDISFNTNGVTLLLFDGKL